ncbi:hypothetical protein AAY81_04075 [Denitrobacterium detoxificans]|uniref:Uncharacterized protein n=1 Tax=Denitrobacterium detoxificans TaxID=79604 RepID=A0A172RXT6_9ACTN|nr:hypothetical protein [Denitrobacterium detoxificans]ANE22433.1 hypothetical protein AAY81_04075 [Denitrobacterium detoxificans]SEO81443.1 hypothetical protein SAMN02910314_01295 [Denitrobacterium detoxificans]SEP01484.1 hypothetical protein SAMN02910314_01919 [Denitrobacterium detoxificans]
MRWTTEQDDALRAAASTGAAGARTRIFVECGVLHTEEAVIRRASRLGVSLARYEICPECGRKVPKLDRDGRCRVCHKRWLATEQRKKNERLRAEIRRNESDGDYLRACREHAAARQEATRIRRAARGSNAGRGDSADLSEVLSTRRPEGEKTLPLFGWDGNRGRDVEDGPSGLPGIGAARCADAAEGTDGL